MYVLKGQCNADGFALYLGLKLYKNMQDFYVGNSRSTGMMLCPYSCMTKVVLAHLICFCNDRFITLLNFLI